MAEQTARQWQVTCACGWRTHGTKGEVVVSVQAHAVSAHAQQLTEEQVVEHALRHLAWLSKEEHVIGEALPEWASALESYVPEPFRALGSPPGVG